MFAILLFSMLTFAQWNDLGEVANSHAKNIVLTIAVKQRNLDILEKTLLEVSDPKSRKYGDHLSFDDINKIVAPWPESKDAVRHFFGNFSVEDLGDFMRVSMSLKEAEKMLGAKYHEFAHTSGQTAWRMRVDDYSLPSALVGHVDFIAPTTTFPLQHFVKSISTDLSENTPPKLRKLYNFTDNDIGKLDAANPMAVASFLEQYYSPSDLEKFWSTYGVPQTEITDVPKNQKHGTGIEAELDVQYITAMGQKIVLQMWYTAGRQPHNAENEPFLNWITNVQSYNNPPHVFSISYGDEESGVQEDYAVRVCNEFMKLGTAGISVLVASGDSGVGCSYEGFVPTYPAACPWVTSVGGTSGGEGRFDNSESVWSDSGGGFSNYFSQPDYQKDAVQTYFNRAELPPQRRWNKTGRGFPDVSAQSVGFVVIASGEPLPGVAGTSAACPTFAGTVALLNQQRRDASGKNLGFLNPLIYQMADAGEILNDVTDGSNDYCGAEGGFSAEKGWDPASGNGTPNYGKMKAYILNL